MVGRVGVYVARCGVYGTYVARYHILVHICIGIKPCPAGLRNSSPISCVAPVRDSIVFCRRPLEAPRSHYASRASEGCSLHRRRLLSAPSEAALCAVGGCSLRRRRLLCAVGGYRRTPPSLATLVRWPPPRPRRLRRRRRRGGSAGACRDRASTPASTGAATAAASRRLRALRRLRRRVLLRSRVPAGGLARAPALLQIQPTPRGGERGSMPRARH